MNPEWDKAIANTAEKPEAGALERYYNRYGQEAMLLAAHAAFLPALTPDLLYKLWFNFKENRNDEAGDAIALRVSDLLLSPLCREVGRGLFEMKASVRETLLHTLQDTPELGRDRLFKLARFTYYYWRDNPSSLPSPAYSEALRWTAEMYLHPGKIARELIALLQNEAANTPRFYRMFEAATMRSRLLQDAQNNSRITADPMNVALNLVQGLQRYNKGNKTEALAFLQQVAPFLKKAGDEKAIRVELANELIEALTNQEEAPPPQPSRLYAKIVLITEKALDKTQALGRIFGGKEKFPEVDSPLSIYEWSTTRQNYLTNELINSRDYEVWQFDEEAVHPVLDAMLISENAIYVAAVVYAGKEKLFKQIERKIHRVHCQINSASQYLHVVIFVPTNDEVDKTDISVAIQQTFPEVQRVAFVLPDDPEPFSAISLPDLRSPVPLFTQENVLRLQDYCFTGPRSYMLFSELDALCGKFDINQGREDALQQCIDAGLLLAGANWRQREEFILGVTITGFADFFQRLVFRLFDDPQLKNEKGILSFEQFRGIVGPQNMSGLTFKLIALLESYGVLSWKESEGAVFVPALLDKADLTPVVDTYSSPCSFVKWRFPYLSKAVFYMLQARLYAMDWQNIRCSDKLISLSSPSGAQAELTLTTGDEAIELCYNPTENNIALAQELTESIPRFVHESFPFLTYKEEQLTLPAYTNPRMAFVEGGTFVMGDVMGDNEYKDETPLHKVTLNNLFLGAYAVTFDEYDAFCAATKRKKTKDEDWGRANRPVIKVSWYDAVTYCNWLSVQHGYRKVYTIYGNTVKADWSADGYRLPTEAEWEYAARALNGKGGGKVRFGNGKDIADPKEINFDGSENYKKAYSIAGEYRRETTPVGSFAPNSLGLYDMSGNVWEWCWDWYDDYSSEAQNNPKGPDSGSDRVLRGGSWRYRPVAARCAYRNYYTPDVSYDYLGFRLARAAR